jgi:putative transcriptional regulator
MVRWKISELLKKRGWTAYRLAIETGLTVPAVYRLAKQSAQMGRVQGTTLDRLCEALQVQPGELLEHIPDKPSRKQGMGRLNKKGEQT